MRTAVISDMHGNCVAFDAVVAELEAEKPDQIVCLGDIAQGGPQPIECVERLRALDCATVQGNSDAWLGLRAPKEFTEKISDGLAGVGAWSVERLGADGTDFLAGLPHTLMLDAGDGVQLTGFHGSPRSYHDVLLPETDEEEFRMMLGDARASIMVGGHTHLQQVRRVDGTLFLNPGSIGAAYDRHQDEASFRFDAWAEYAMITVERARIRFEFRRVPFDVDALLREVATSGMPAAEGWTRRYASR